MATLNNAAYARSFFESRGYSAEQAAAIVGNLMQESYSDLRTGAAGDPSVPGGSHGIAQWNRDRLDNLKAFAVKQGKPWTDFNTQLAFVDNELRGKPGTDPGAGARANAWTNLQSGNLTDKTLSFRKYYEGAQPAADYKRIANASSILGVPVPAGYTPSSDVATLNGGQGSDSLVGRIGSDTVGTGQDLINRAVQLSTRRGEAMPAAIAPGSTPSRGRLVDRILGREYLGLGSSANAAAATPASPVQQAAVTPSGTYFEKPPVQQAATPNIVPQNNNFQNLKPSVQVGQAAMPSGTYFAKPPVQQAAATPSGTYFSSPPTAQAKASQPMSLADYVSANLPASSSSSGHLSISAPQQAPAQVDQNNIQAGLVAAAPPQGGLMQASTKPQAGYAPVNPGAQPSTLEEMLRRMMGGTMA